MALGDGKALFLSNVDAQKTTFITQVIQAEDDMSTSLLASKDPAQNATQRQLKWEKIFNEFKNVLEIAFDSTMTEIQTNGQVSAGISVTIPVTSGPGTPSTGSTTTTGTIV